MTPLVLLPGMMCDARLFAPQIAALSFCRAIHVAPIGGHETMQALAEEVLEHAPERFANPLAPAGHQGRVDRKRMRLFRWANVVIELRQTAR